MLVDLTYIYNVPTETVALITSLTAIGSILGAFSAIMFRWINRQFTLSIALIVGSIAFGFIPHGSSFAVVYVFALLLGYSQGILDTSETVWLVELWHENPNPVMQLSQALFGVGTIVAPLIAGPYLTGDIDTNSTNTTLEFYEYRVAVTPEERRAKLTIPFAVLSALTLVGVVANLLMFFIRRYEPPPKEILEKSRDEDGEETKLFERPGKLKIVVIALASLCLGSFVCVEGSFFNFSATFAQYIPLKVSAPDAATIQSVFAVAFTIARGLNFFVAMKLKPSQLLIMHYSIIVLSQICLLFADKSLVVLWIANISIGYGFSAMWSSVLAFTEKYIILNDTVGGVMLAFAGIFGAVIPYLIGWLIESEPMALVYIGMGIMGFSIMMYVAIRLMVRALRSKELKK